MVLELTKVAHRLFPRHVKTLFSSVKLEVLQDMEKALKCEPWILGFQKILQERFGISGFEVKIPSFVNCNLLKKMPVMNCDALYIYNALCKVTYKYGHTYFPLKQLKSERYFKPPFTTESYRVTCWDDSLDYLKAINAVKIGGECYGTPTSLFLPHIRRYEQTIARTICKMRKTRPWVNGVEIDEKVFGGDADQLRAAKMITTNSVVVLSGRGGCGKTHVVSSVLSQALKVKRAQLAADGEFCAKQDEQPLAGCFRSLTGVSHTVFQGCTGPLPTSANSLSPETPPNIENCSQNPDISQHETAITDPCGDAVLLTAPTGRAACILGKRTGLQAYTLHSVIFSYLRWLKAAKNGESQSAWKFSEVKLLVCDETSLVSVKTFATLMNILSKKCSLQQIVLLGDKHQLPSIEPGNFLGDVYNALLEHGCSVMLRTNHRAESQLIAQNAGRISCQQMPFFPDDPKRGFISFRYQSKQSESGVESDDMAVTQMVRDLLENKISAVNLPEPDKSQFIAFRRTDCLNINELCARHYNKHSIKDAKGKLDFQVGDKVCVKKTIVCFDVHSKEDVKFCNGEIFFIREIIDEEDNRNKKTTYLSLDNGEKIMKIDKKMLLKAKLCHAWARTIHTFQGSEIDTVVYVVGSPMYQSCQHVYTAITRGIRQVIVINDPKHLEQAVRTKPFARKTRLHRYLAEDLRKPVCDDPEEDAGEGTCSTDLEKTSADAGVFLTQTPDLAHSSCGFQTASQLLCSGAYCEALRFNQSQELFESPQSAANASDTWEDAFKDDNDDEILAWAFEAESHVQPLPSKRQCSSSPHDRGLGSASTAGDFYISRSNLKTKKEKRDEADYPGEGASDSLIEGSGTRGLVSSGNLVGARVMSDKTRVPLSDSCNQFFGCLSFLAHNATGSSRSSVNQWSPLTDSANPAGCISPKSCLKMPPACFTFPTPPQTPTSTKRTPAGSAKYQFNSVPRKSNPPRASPVRKYGGSPSKGRRKSFTAQYDSMCSLCRGPIYAKRDEITHLENGTTMSWVHQNCV
ncbi:DNA helicase B-like isoform X2 [Montipora foliosa]